MCKFTILSSNGIKRLIEHDFTFFSLSKTREKYKMFLKVQSHRVECPKFEHLALSSKFYNHALNTNADADAAAVGMLL